MDASPFMNFPAELRILIYEALFENTECYLQIYKHHIQLCRYFSQCPPLPLLLTNKTISKGVQDVLYEQTLFDVQLHMQHLPLQETQTPTEEEHIESLFIETTGHRRYKYGSMVALQLPIKMQTFLQCVQRLQLNVWIYDAGKAEEMVEQIEAFDRSLQSESERDGRAGRRMLIELRIKLRLRPRWLQGDECTPMQQGEVDALVYALREIECVKDVEWVVERDAKSLISPICWKNVLEGRASVVI